MNSQANQTHYDAAADIVAKQVLARQAHTVGVCWSGLSPDAPVVETVEAVAERLAFQDRARENFRNSPRGQFWIALAEIEDAGGFAAEVEKLQGIYRRSLSDPRQPLDCAAIGSALVILDAMTVTGRSAREALHRMLMSDSRRAVA